MNKKIVGVVFAVMLSMLLIESYVLFNQPKHTPNPEIGTSDSTSPTITSQSPNESSTESSNTTTESASPEVSFSPSIPEFTVKLLDSSYDVPTTYSTDPYTGKQVAQGGYHVARRTIEIRIKNQPFTSYIDSGGRNISFYYNIRMKGHYTEKWDDIYSAEYMPTRSGSQYTVISYNSESRYSFDLAPVSRMLEVSPDGEIDFQMQALVGYRQDTFFGNTFSLSWIRFYRSRKKAAGANTQTITFPLTQSNYNSFSHTQNPKNGNSVLQQHLD